MTQPVVEVHGYALRAIREREGLKPADLADEIFVDRSYITKLELGHSRRMAVPTYFALVRALSKVTPLDPRALLAVAPDRDTNPIALPVEVA